MITTEKEITLAEVNQRLVVIEALVIETHNLALLDSRFGSKDKYDEYVKGFNDRMDKARNHIASGS